MNHRWSRSLLTASLVAGLALIAPGSSAWAGGESETWFFDETTTGEDISWVSPTGINPNAPLYEAEYIITLVEIHVEWLGIPFGPIDVTDQIPPENRAGSGSSSGPAPITLINQSIIFPEPPEPPAIAADLAMGLNSSGFGFLDVTNIVLGTLIIDLGAPFGEQEVELTSLRIAGQLTISANLCPADLNGDGMVGPADLASLLAAWGPNPGHPADFNFDGIVGPADLAQLLAAWGPCG